MNSDPFGIPVRDLSNSSTHWRKKIMPDDALHFMPPHGGTWGLVRTSLQLPGSIVLMAAPPVCARITGLRELRLDFRERFFFLNVGEEEFANGSSESMILDAVDEIISYLDEKPKFLFFCETCLDDLLGSDYPWLSEQVERRYGIRSTSLHLKPTSAEGRRPGGLLTQKAIYDLIRPVSGRDKGINLMGSALPIDRNSEFYTLVERAGIGPVRHISECTAPEDFDRMSGSSWNILYRPAARLAVRSMKENYGIPYLHLPGAYGLETVDENYRLLEDFFGVELETKPFREETEEFLLEQRNLYRGMEVAVGASVYTGPFELARALIEYGMDVRYVFANVVMDIDSEPIRWLKEKRGDLMVYPSSHTSMARFHSLRKKVDLAFGYEAGYFCSEAKTVDLSADKPFFGYWGIRSLFQEIRHALSSPRSHRQSMYSNYDPSGSRRCGG